MATLKVEIEWKMFSKYRPQHTQQILTRLVNRLVNGIRHGVVAQTMLFRMVKTAGLYLVPVKVYSKNGHPYLILKRVLTPRHVLRDKKKASAGPKGQLLSALKDGFFWTA